MKRVIPALLVTLLLMLTACGAPETITQPTAASTVAPVYTNTSMASTPPEPTSAPSLDEAVDVLNSFMVELSASTGIVYTRGFDSDNMVYNVTITANETLSTLIKYLLYGDLNADDYSEIYASVRESLDTMDELSGTLKTLIDQNGHAECGVMVHLEIQGMPYAPVYISADGEELVSVIDAP